MYEQVEKPKEKKGRTVANSVVKKSDGKQGLGFIANRFCKISQLKHLSNNECDTVLKQEYGNPIQRRIQGVPGNISGAQQIEQAFNLIQNQQLRDWAMADPEASVRIRNMLDMNKEFTIQEFNTVLAQIRDMIQERRNATTDDEGAGGGYLSSSDTTKSR